MAGTLDGRNALVTGAGRGIGREIALAFAREGANVLVNDLGITPEGGQPSHGPADEVVAECRAIGVQAVANYDSVSDFQAAEQMVKTCVSGFGRIDILVNNAGIQRHRLITELTEEDWDTVIGSHLKGAFNLCRHAAPFMIGQRYGRIINITSRQWLRAEGRVNYAAAKGGIVSLTYGLALELERWGITCNAVAPLAATERFRAMMPEFKSRMEGGLITEGHYQRLLNQAGPEFVPPIVVYLASDHAAHVNEKIFHIDGGTVSIFSKAEEVRTIYKDHREQGSWTPDELIEVLPRTLLAGI